MEFIFSLPNDSLEGPEAELIILSKIIVLQLESGLSDFGLKKQCINLNSFRKCLGFPECIT